MKLGRECIVMDSRGAAGGKYGLDISILHISILYKCVKFS